MNGQAERDSDDLESQETAGEAGEDAIAESAADAGSSEPVDELVALKETADQNWDKYVRAAAELENVRKRAARDVENARRFALERFASELLAVRDSLEMGLSAGTDTSQSALLEGSEATLKLLGSTMEQFGVAEVDPLGEPFDPEFHEAMTMQPSADVEPGSVLTVFQKGYTLNGRLLRPARVVVAQAPPAEETEQ
ncbi:MAG: nucleotide exchange factor GrpE [Pseudomonadota bacterium]